MLDDDDSGLWMMMMDDDGCWLKMMVDDGRWWMLMILMMDNDHRSRW